MTTLKPWPKRPKTLRLRPPLEAVEQRTVVKLFTAAGFHVGATSQYRRSGQMVGLADLVLFHPGIGRAGWWETKPYKPTVGYNPADRSTWEVKDRTEDQIRFGDRALQCGQLYGWGGLLEAEKFLIELGLMYRAGNGSLQLVHKGKPYHRGTYR